MSMIQKQTIKFLKDLKKNNNRPWFNDHKDKYLEAKENIEDILSEVKKDLEKTDHLEKMKMFRIYRDVRFSKDKSPYKTNFGASFSRASAALRGGYYLHIEPENTFIGGGFWKPNSGDLKRIRKEMEFDAEPLRKIIAASSFQKYFGELEGDEVKTAPRGFDPDHPNIDLIRKKQYLVMRKIDDKTVLQPSFPGEVVKTFEAMRPFFDYMSLVLTTDLNGESIL